MVFIWLFYILGAGLFSGMAIAQMSIGTAAPFLRWETAIIVNAIQVAVGILLLSVASVTSLADDRIRGTFEVLLTAPISTAAIVQAKWLIGARQAIAVAIFPIIVGFAIACYTNNTAQFLMLTALILAYGAVITSLGLAVATWVRRYGRAIALTVAIYVVVSITFIVIPALFWDRGGEWTGVLLCGSPFYGAAVLTDGITDRQGTRVPEFKPMEWGAIWVVLYTTIALALYFAVIATFNRCLGRISGGRSGRNWPSLEESDGELVPPAREDWWKLSSIATSPPLSTNQRSSNTCA
jgi:ABC-type transport system involved in multi-copper enzyme maturation permease subunit